MTRAALRPLRLGTRASALALAQSQTVAAALGRHDDRPVTLVHISTAGDRSTAPIAELGGTGVFVSALRDALRRGEIDLAVHSFKDLPTAAAPHLVVAAVPPREDPRDALVARDGLTLAALPAGARVGTGAPRRVAQLLALRPDLVTVPIRGNVDTRLRRVADGDLDAVVLACAGLARLGRTAEVTEAFDPGVMLPAPAQGALAVECRADDAALLALLAALDHPPTRVAVTAERALLTALEAGCTAPVGAYAELGTAADGAASARSATLHLTAAVTATDGTATVRSTASGTPTDADAIGRRLAADLLAGGADTLIGSTS